jgi:hypothetical protein
VHFFARLGQLTAQTFSGASTSLKISGIQRNGLLKWMRLQTVEATATALADPDHEWDF